MELILRTGVVTRPFLYLYFMSLIKKHIAQIKASEKRLEDIAQKSVRDNMETILGILKENQLHQGIKSDGTSTPKYKKITEEWASFSSPREPKVAGQPWNLDWSGSWIEGMYIKLSKDGYSILSSDGKTAMLESMVGGKLTKLTEQNNDLINETIIKPDLYRFMLTSIVKF